MPRAYAIVLNWNRWPETIRCVDAVVALEADDLRVVVVDNGSDDQAGREHLADRDVDFIQTGANLGYAGGNNIGIRHALEHRPEYVWILNNDVRPTRGAFQHLVGAADEDATWGALSSRIVTPEGHEDVGLIIPEPARRWDPFDAISYDAICNGVDASTVRQVAFLRGPSLFLRRVALEGTGLFDERYFHYFEEMDLMVRLRRAGWRLGVACASIVEHEKGATLGYATPQAHYYLTRNQLIFERKLFGASPLRVLARHPIRRLRAFLALRHAAHGDFRLSVAQARGLIDGVRGRTGPVDLGAAFWEPL